MTTFKGYLARTIGKIAAAAAPTVPKARSRRYRSDPEGRSVLSRARVRDLGSSYSVSVSEAMIYEWIQRWPASGLRGLKGVTFEFDKRNGDLIDVHYKNGKSERWDGPALLALSEDAQVVGQARLAGRR